MIKDKKFLIILTLFFLVLSALFFGKSSNFLIDFSRELTVPYQMLNGQKPFEDIFLIYGFWGYFVNFLLYKINLNTNLLLFEAVIVSYIITILFYSILLRFCSKATSLAFSVFFILCSVFSCATFSYSVPYSYSVLWAYFALYLILFAYFYKKDSFLYLSLGLLAVCKIEFFIIFGFLILLLKMFKKEKFSYKALYFLIFPSIFVFYILITHISFDSIFNNFTNIKLLVKTQALSYFYKGMGVFFEKKYFLYNLCNLLLCTAAFYFSYFLYKKEKKTLSYLLIILFFIILKVVFVLNLALFVLFGLFVFTLCKKKLSENEIILVIFSILMSIKSAFALNIYGYGNFSFVMCVFCIFLLLSKIFDERYLKSYFLIYFVFLSTVNIGSIILDAKVLYHSHFGTVYIKKSDSLMFEYVNGYIKENISDSKTLLVMPEGQIFNFINNKKWQYYNSTFTPLDFETFGDEYFISKLKEYKTDYIIIFPRDTADYKKTQICSDYAVDFCSYVSDNYIKVNDLEKYNVKIFKRKYE